MTYGKSAVSIVDFPAADLAAGKNSWPPCVGFFAILRAGGILFLASRPKNGQQAQLWNTGCDDENFRSSFAGDWTGCAHLRRLSIYDSEEGSRHGAGTD